ncbi:RNB domain-containing ribonuclease [Actinokineospora bangkokensis]|uniref:Ribonuclease II n=1 Tax=Actinokineospora bangkokensis TaxID=1193682 RepID=A0A1Q9LDV4_9PSEU|nr:RNB domain-containing ribonuclease [Actinokineospora bangkokensis]OLR90196.1 ribonuclease II [Actinokineospora bangkokensis]
MGQDFSAIRRDFDLPEHFPPGVRAEAERAVVRHERRDATDIPLVTIDPPGARDLDQAMAIERTGSGYRVHYAIADLGSVVAPEGELDREARRRGQTLYLPDGKVPLHPPVLSEAGASLLPDQDTPAALWTIELDERGEPVSAHVERALVRSRAQLDYDTARHPSMELLPEVGKLRRAAAVARGAVELHLPEQQVEGDGSTGYRLVLRPRTELEAWNAEISLLTGMCAARIMLDARVGILRTLPEPDDGAVRGLRRSAAALGLPWPAGTPAGEFLAGLDPARPAAMALFMDATRLLRGAGYTAFDGAEPEQRLHAGVAAPYAHVTAPLRRLVDRFGTEVCLALCAGEPVPDWVRRALPELPGLMETSDALAGKVDRACLDQVEAWVLADRVGEVFDAVVLRAEATGGEVFLADPPVLAKCSGEGLPEGETTRVRLTAADPDRRRVGFERATSVGADTEWKDTP